MGRLIKMLFVWENEIRGELAVSSDSSIMCQEHDQPPGWRKLRTRRLKAAANRRLRDPDIPGATTTVVVLSRRREQDDDDDDE